METEEEKSPTSDPRLPDMRKREVLLVHIEGLQATLTKRNARIAELEAQLAADPDSPVAQREITKAYNRGWRECSQHLTNVTGVAAQALGRVRSDAWALYLGMENENLDSTVTDREYR